MAASILIVDDDPATLAGLISLVGAAGHSVVAAGDFAEGRRLLSHLTFDLVIVDVRLGAYNGLQLIVLSRNHPRPPAAIVTSGFEDAVLAQEARQLGAPFVLKPIDPERFLELVAERLEGPQAP